MIDDELTRPLAEQLRIEAAVAGEDEASERMHERRWYARTETRLAQSGATYRITTGDPNGGALLEVDLPKGRFTVGTFPQQLAQHVLHWAVDHDNLCKIAVAALYENGDLEPLEELHKAMTAAQPVKKHIRVRVDMLLNTEQEVEDIARAVRDMVNARSLSLDLVSSIVQVDTEKVVV